MTMKTWEEVDTYKWKKAVYGSFSGKNMCKSEETRVVQSSKMMVMAEETSL